MATRTISITPRQIGPSQVTSAGRNIPARVTKVKVELVSPDWMTTTGTVNWGMEGLGADGVWQTVAANDVAMGKLSRDGVSMPSITEEADVLSQYSQLRLFASCSVPIDLGADITVTFS